MKYGTMDVMQIISCLFQNEVISRSEKDKFCKDWMSCMNGEKENEQIAFLNRLTELCPIQIWKDKLLEIASAYRKED